MSTTDEAIANTLALVNVARTSFGYKPLAELPNSSKGHSHDCLYARALSDIGVMSVGGGGDMVFSSERVAQTVGKLWNSPVDGTQVVAPPAFAHVIGKFDSSNLPHYNT